MRYVSQSYVERVLEDLYMSDEVYGVHSTVNGIEITINPKVGVPGNSNISPIVAVTNALSDYEVRMVEEPGVADGEMYRLVVSNEPVSEALLDAEKGDILYVRLNSMAQERRVTMVERKSGVRRPDLSECSDRRYHKITLSINGGSWFDAFIPINMEDNRIRVWVRDEMHENLDSNNSETQTREVYGPEGFMVHSRKENDNGN